MLFKMNENFIFFLISALRQLTYNASGFYPCLNLDSLVQLLTVKNAFLLVQHRQLITSSVS